MLTRKNAKWYIFIFSTMFFLFGFWGGEYGGKIKNQTAVRELQQNRNRITSLQQFVREYSTDRERERTGIKREREAFERERKISRERYETIKRIGAINADNKRLIGELFELLDMAADG